MARREVEVDTVVDGVRMTVVRKGIRNMYVRIYHDGRVRISLPFRVTDREAESFIASKLPWIKEQRSHMETAPEERQQPQFAPGSIFHVWGKGLMIREMVSPTDRAEIDDDTVILHLRPGATDADRLKALNALLRREMERALPSVAAAAQCIVGLSAEEWRLRDMRTKWGTCNIGAKRIWLNIQLAKRDPSCLEYVTIHELTHLRAHHHDARFKAYMDIYCPDWRERKKLLNSPL
jgi:predicted metal-dependent hydrolase